ncbi:MAG: response regulator transcription factor [Chloroflexi bacterium]|nr:response regulator transcription factor [Chloroflexota bacterium]
MGERIRLLLACKTQIFREGLARLVADQAGMEVVGVCGCDTDLGTAVNKASPDVVLLDAEVFRSTRLDVSRILEATGSKLLILIDPDNDSELLLAAKCGTAGCISKDIAVADLVVAIKLFVRGASVMFGSVASRRLQASTPDLARGDQLALLMHSLTSREREILQLVRRGAKNREIAASLFISEQTVKVHMRNIMQKLQVHSRLEAVLLARKDSVEISSN